MNSKMRIAVSALCVCAAACAAGTQPVARISSIEGKVSMLRTGGAKWTDARPDLELKEGDQVYCREESFAEIVYPTGVVMRMDEKTKVTIVRASENATAVRSGVGNVWVNMRKLVSTEGKRFELSTPTATAAIRGTAFNATTNPDSSTDVAVYNGTVAVGPGAESGNANKAPEAPSAQTAPVEVPGPEEIPGPYEVSLEEWVNIVAGQRISVRADGKFAQEKFNMQDAAAKDDFVKKNIALDKQIAGQK